jgi:hypothetical protein
VRGPAVIRAAAAAGGIGDSGNSGTGKFSHSFVFFSLTFSFFLLHILQQRGVEQRRHEETQPTDPSYSC